MTAILFDRTIGAYFGVLSAFLKGHTFLPINVKHPVSHNTNLLSAVNPDNLIYSKSSEDYLVKLVENILNEGINFEPKLIPTGSKKESFSRQLSNQNIFSSPSDDSIAYVLFTSGSTGNPKGVPVSYSNLWHYIKSASSILQLNPNDITSQNFDLTFDLSMHDLFVSWFNGCHLAIPTEKELKNPAHFIKDKKLTCWFSVPTLAYQVLTQVKPENNEFEHLRYSLFCGEPLPLDLAMKWQSVAQNSKVQNWYGPTEATIACSYFEFSSCYQDNFNKNDYLPIGTPFPSVTFSIIDQKSTDSENFVFGELKISGPQIASGYINNDDATEANFCMGQTKEKNHYRTGDVVYRSGDGTYWFGGRNDNQIKLKGYRVDLDYVEAVLRKCCSGQNIAVVSISSGSEMNKSLVAVIETNSCEENIIKSKLAELLPAYMVPSRIIPIELFPSIIMGRLIEKNWLKNFKKNF